MIESTRESDVRPAVVLVHPLGDLAAALPEATIEVGSVLDAVGLVARATGQPRIGAVVLSHAELERFPDAPAALKRLDDEVRVVLVVAAPGPGSDPASVRANGVDAVVDPAADPESLTNAIAGRPPATIATPAAPRPEPPASVAASASAGPAGEPAGSETAVSDASRGEVAAWPFEPVAGRRPSPGDPGGDVPVRSETVDAAELVDEAERRALVGPPDAPLADPSPDPRAGSDPPRPARGLRGFEPVHPSPHDPAAAAPVDAADEPADPGPAVRPPAPAHAPGAIDAPADESTEPHPRPVSEEEPGPTAPSPGVEGGAPAPRPPAPEPPPPADAPPPDAPPPLSFAEAVRAREERYEAETQPAEPLGDIDLVEAVLGGGGRIGPVAVRLVREQTGWDDLAFHLEEPARTDPDVARAEVADEGRRFGTLTSRVAGADELELWAGWLARWLELGRRHELFRTESRTDELTGAANRRAMFEFLDRVLREARARRRPVTVMVFDIDDFKRFNDDHGHEAGDIILRETVALLKSVTRRADLVCRVGGDEFAVVFADLEGPRTAGSSMIEDVSVIARRFQQQVVRMRFPRLGLDAPGTLSISAGLASYPWDGSDPASLLRVADRRALESKRRGKNHITFGPGVPLLEPGDEHDAGDDDGA